MIDTSKWLDPVSRPRYAGFDTTIDSISWLLILLVVLDIVLLPITGNGALFLFFCCFMLRLYHTASRFVLIRIKGILDLLMLLSFAVAASWFTGKAYSPFVSIIYVILMITSLTQGKRATYLLAAVAMASYALLAAAHPSAADVPTFSRALEFLPFLLIAHLGALLSGEAESARMEVERLSLTDDLTELNNMRSFENLATHQERLAKRQHRPFAVCMLDTDNLKQINDRHGHLAGTALIKWTAHLIRQNIRESDIAARFGGDEFVILFHGADKGHILPAVERIVRAMANTPFPFEGEMLRSTLSAGIASYPADGSDVRTIVGKADQAMYLSKRQGKNRVSLYREESAD